MKRRWRRGREGVLVSAVLEANDLQNESFLQKPLSVDVLARRAPDMLN